MNREIVPRAALSGLSTRAKVILQNASEYQFSSFVGAASANTLR